MHVELIVSHAELAEMGSTEERLKEGVVQALDAGIEDGDGTLYLAGFSVAVRVIDLDAQEVRMREAFEAKYQRDWEDPAGDDMKSVWADAWAAATATA